MITDFAFKPPIGFPARDHKYLHRSAFGAKADIEDFLIQPSPFSRLECRMMQAPAARENQDQVPD